jgi:hypothetical protein
VTRQPARRRRKPLFTRHLKALLVHDRRSQANTQGDYAQILARQGSLRVVGVMAIFRQLTLCESVSVCTVAAMGQRERRNQEITSLHEALKDSPTDLALANRYWLALAGEADLRSGSNVIETYRAAALSSKDGVEALACSYRDVFQMSGEVPRPAYFDDKLVMALKAGMAELAGSESSALEWLLRSIGVEESC